MKVMIIDDDPITCFLHETLLKELGIGENHIVHQDCSEAFKDLQKYTDLSLILLDLDMPLLNGFDFLAMVTSDTNSVAALKKIVVVTSSCHPRDLEKLKDFGVSFIIEKPLSNDNLSEVISQMD